MHFHDPTGVMKEDMSSCLQVPGLWTSWH